LFTGAFTIYAAMLWTTFSVMFPAPPVVQHALDYAGSGAAARGSMAGAYTRPLYSSS
jgi:hypothetical protein